MGFVLQLLLAGLTHLYLRSNRLIDANDNQTLLLRLRYGFPVQGISRKQRLKSFDKPLPQSEVEVCAMLRVREEQRRVLCDIDFTVKIINGQQIIH